MNTLLFALITVAFIVLVVVVVYVMFDIRKAIISLRQFVESADKTLRVLTEETNLTLKSVRDAGEGITTITDDVREVCGSVRAIGDSLKGVSQTVRRLTGDVEFATSDLSARLCAIRAGIGAALSVIQKGLRK